jgi:hypothetical protein
MPAHSNIGGSSAGRWMNCPGSVNFISQLVKEPPGEYAMEGTAAHQYAEVLFGVRTKVDKHLQKYLNDELFDYVKTYYEAVLKNHTGGPARELFIEQLVNLAWLHPKLKGTADAIVREAFGVLDVWDLKYGKGVVVEVEENPQQMYYALGALKELGYECTHVRMNIVQPRAFHPKGPVRSWMLPVEELYEWGENVLKPAAYATEAADAPLCPGPWCAKYFCPARAGTARDGKPVICKALVDHSYDVAKQEFNTIPEEITLPDIKTLGVTDTAKVLHFLSILKPWMEKVWKHAQEAMEGGAEIPGFKLVAKRANRKYIEEKEVLEILKEFGDQVFKPRSLINLTNMQKLVGKDLMKEICYVPEAGITIALESDKRPAVSNAAELDFEKIKTEEE